MKKVWLAVSIFIVLGIFVWAQVPMAKTRGDRELVSQEVSSSPVDANSAQWEKAKTATFILTGAGSAEGEIVEMKAASVHTENDIFFRFEWADKDLSMKKNSWKRSGEKWVKQKLDEDRLGVIFEISRINKFATKGCAILCHNESKNEKEWYYSTNNRKERGEFWHWKAARSNPVGYTEDGYLTDNPSKKPEKARLRDSGKGKASNNRTADKKGPSHIQAPGTSPSIENVLLTSEAVKIDPSMVMGENIWVPGYLMNANWSGSFADIKTQGVWKDGKWVVMMSRKLDTGNDDDLQFNTRKKYSFMMASFDNAHEHNSHNSEVLKLKFK